MMLANVACFHFESLPPYNAIPQFFSVSDGSGFEGASQEADASQRNSHREKGDELQRLLRP